MRRWKLFDNRENYLYKATHINHPSAIWCRESVSNYNWLSDHMFALLSEYTYRYEKEHKVQGYLSYLLQSPPFNLKKFEWTEMPCAMPDEYKISDDPVINYRQYYKYGKKDLHNWKKRDAPQWMQSWT
jgi:hypothetical protein